MHLCDYPAMSPHGREYLLVQSLYLYKTVLYVHIVILSYTYIGFMNFNKNTLISYKHACMQAGESSRFSPQLHTCFTYVKQESKLRIHKYNKACTIRTYMLQQLPA